MEVLTPKTIFVLGGEHSGVSGDMIQIADRCLLIPGTGHVESLNVSVAGAVLLSELYRQVNSTAPSEKPSKSSGAGSRRPDHSNPRKPTR